MLQLFCFLGKQQGSRTLNPLPFPAEQVQGGQVLLQAEGGSADGAVPVHDPGRHAGTLPHRSEDPRVDHWMPYCTMLAPCKVSAPVLLSCT